MASTARRIGTQDSATRSQLVQAGIELLQTEGAASFSARRVAEIAGLKPQLVHYYFRTMEDLAVAICEEAGARSRQRAIDAVSGDEPLRGLWRVTVEERSAPLTTEVNSLAQKSTVLRNVTIRMLEEYRTAVAGLLAQKLGAIDDGVRSSMTIVMVCDALGHMLTTERALGADIGHAELIAGIEKWLDSHYS